MNSYVFDFLVRTRISIYFSFFIFQQTPVPGSLEGRIPERIIEISAGLSSVDDRFKPLAQATGVGIKTMSLKERLELTAELNALVARHYGLSRSELEVIMNSYDSFEEDKNLENLKDVRWNDALIRKFNGEARKRVLLHFDRLVEEMKAER